MTADTDARLVAAYLLGALDAHERLAYEARPSYLQALPDCRSLVRPPGPQPASAYADVALAAGGDGAPGESGEVAGVVNAMDGGESAAVPLDLVNAGGAKV